tara:strand:- start:73 stop:336 length:264 start_codon:yes stop_codon:yes gene_type:complete
MLTVIKRGNIMIELKIYNQPYLIDINKIIFVELNNFSLTIYFKNNKITITPSQDYNWLRKLEKEEGRNDIKQAYSKLKKMLVDCEFK